MTHHAERRPYQRASQDERRTDLINAALKLIGSGGPQAATVRAIAAEAGVTAGLIRHYFNTKEELIRSAYQTVMSRLNTASAPGPANDNPAQRLARFVVTSITPPVADPTTVGQWAGFLHLVRDDAEMREVHRSNYFAYREMLEAQITDIVPSLDQQTRRQAAIACNAVIDGLWLEASLISDSFEADEIVTIGLRSVGKILGVDLMGAYAS